MGGGRADYGGRADGRRTGGQADVGKGEADGRTGDGRTGGQADGTENGGGRADEWTGG